MKSSVELALSESGENISQVCSAHFKQYKDHIRQRPFTHVAFAVVVGYFLEFFPLKKIVLSLIALSVTLLPPTILFFGTIKLVSLLAEKNSKKMENEKKPSNKSMHNF